MRGDGNAEEAAGVLEKGTGFLAGSEKLHMALGQTYDVLKRYDEALEQHTTALKLAPQNPEPHYRYGVTSANCGKNEDARDAYRKALELEKKLFYIFPVIW